MKTSSAIWIAAVCLLLPTWVRADATADLWAALKGAKDPEALAAIKAGADVKKADATASTPLHLAACFAGPEVVKALLNAKSVVDAVAVTGNTPLANAANWGNLDAMKLLLAAGASPKVKNKIGMPVVATALASSKLDAVKMLVEAGADPKESWRVAPSPVDANLVTTMIGSTYAPAQKVKNLKDIYPFIRDKLGLTYPARLLNAQESDFTPLDVFTRYLLEQAGVEVNMKIPAFGSMLGMAAQSKKAGVVKALVEAKADTEVTTYVRGKLSSLQATPLMVAAMNGDNPMAEALIAGGAKVNAIGVEVHSEGFPGSSIITTWTIKNTALSLAIGNGHLDTAAIIQKAGGKGPKEL